MSANSGTSSRTSAAATKSSSEPMTYDVLVIGAGPAGTAAAGVLAAEGRRVALIERDPAPRYRVGESLIPFCWFALNRLGRAADR